MIKRMADKIGQFGQSQKQSSQPGLTNLPYTSMSHSISAAADYHRGSISTQRTSSSEWTQQENNLEAETFPLPRVSRPKASYRLTDFIIQRTLGTGSFGRVHLGMSFGFIYHAVISFSFTVRSKHNLRFYAIKVLNKEKIVRTKQVEHTNNEKMMLEAVQHPFIINLWGAFQDASNLFMVMDFVPGGELFTLLRRSNVSLLQFLLKMF
jgi:serine/threonine protein kinase